MYPYIFQITLLNTVPFHQAEDILMDVNLTRWGFYKALTHKQRMIADPFYRAENNLRVESIPSKITPIDLEEPLSEELTAALTGDVEQ